jgi:DNA-binding CsgD family transcriptional regulator
MGSKKRRNPRAVDTLRENVVQFHEAGFSYAAIAKREGISEAYAVKLVQERYAELRRAAASHVALTARQRRFARALLNGRPPQEAALYAARPGKLSPEEAHAWAHMTMSPENFRLAIRQVFRLEIPEANVTTASNPVEPDADAYLLPARLTIPCTNSRFPVG